MTYLTDSNNESNIRLEKYQVRLEELEQQSLQHNTLHDKMKARLKEMSARIQDQNNEVNYCTENLISKKVYSKISCFRSKNQNLMKH